MAFDIVEFTDKTEKWFSDNKRAITRSVAIVGVTGFGFLVNWGCEQVAKQPQMQHIAKVKQLDSEQKTNYLHKNKPAP